MMFETRGWATPTERRSEIIKVLCNRRYETMGNLANEFGVATRTIRKDIHYLSLSYPIVTIRGRYGGGIKVMGDFDIDRRYLNEQQRTLLEKIKVGLTGRNRSTIDSILQNFALNE